MAHKATRRHRKIGLAAGLLIALGGIVLVAVNAAGAQVALEPEEGNVSGAVVGQTADASGGGYVRFPPASNALTEDFSDLPLQNWADGTTHGQWQAVFDGFGYQGVKMAGSNKVLEQAPQVSAQAGETHASLVVSVRSFTNFSFTAKAVTLQPLRTGTPPNAWERDWIFWQYTDNVHAYYLTCKGNGWELGKLDPAYPGAQRFLATGNQKTCPVGSWHTYKVTQQGATMTATIDGQQIVTFTDSERPYLSGKVGLYNEDAKVQFDDVRVEPAQ